MRKILKFPANLPPGLMERYELTDISSQLHGILLSRTGVTIEGEKVILHLCNACYASFANKKLSSPPKFAIANGLHIGVLPTQFDEPTMTENAMLNLAQPTQFVTVVRGGRHSPLRSHVYFFRATPTPPAQLLPEPVVSKGIIGVSMVGSMTPRQKAETAKRYQIRVSRLRDQYGWYRRNNVLYRNVQLTSSLETDLDESHDQHNVLSDCTTEGNAEESAMANELDAAHWRFNAPAPSIFGANDEDELCSQTAVALVTDYAGEDANTQARTILKDTSDVVVWRSSEILSDFTPAYWIYTFCEPFPYSRGGLDEPRAVRIGVEEYMRYCLRLSHQKHAHHPSFMLVAFNILARHHAMRAVYLRAKLAPHVASSSANVDRSELRSPIEYRDARLKAINQRKRAPDPPPSS
ncbi:hypothetical protein L917_09535 [Phytophthora nicotianae]|uniref:DUF6570 domain-containing protein n=2 Tax=Phytophthora nicotianae TaxID=4792 RepID=V9F396_PHYNI|nr:hypothetical protein F443_09909 [Phytophthora nicotianae P1569]ETL92031.1 hypothetical protein L917_09535 [Phytophthora nicotianae]